MQPSLHLFLQPMGLHQQAFHGWCNHPLESRYRSPAGRTQRDRRPFSKSLVIGERTLLAMPLLHAVHNNYCKTGPTTYALAQGAGQSETRLAPFFAIKRTTCFACDTLWAGCSCYRKMPIPYMAKGALQCDALQHQ